MYINLHHSASSRSFHRQCWTWEIIVLGASVPEPIIWVRCSSLGKPPENRCFDHSLPQGLRVPSEGYCLKIPRLTTAWRLGGSDQQLRQTWTFLRVHKEKMWDHSGLWILEPGWIVLQEKSRGVIGLSSKFPSFFPPSFPQRASFNERNSHNVTLLEYFLHLMQVQGLSPKDLWSCQRWLRLGEKSSEFSGEILILFHVFHSAGQRLILSPTALSSSIGKGRAASMSHMQISHKPRILNPDDAPARSIFMFGWVAHPRTITVSKSHVSLWLWPRWSGPGAQSQWGKDNLEILQRQRLSEDLLEQSNFNTLPIKWEVPRAVLLLIEMKGKTDLLLYCKISFD